MIQIACGMNYCNGDTLINIAGDTHNNGSFKKFAWYKNFKMPYITQLLKTRQTVSRFANRHTRESDTQLANSTSSWILNQFVL